MGIDPSRLSPWAQKQIADKVTAQMREKAAKQAQERADAKRKYHNIPTQRSVADGKQIRFDSKREAARYDELMILLRAGKIRDLKLQPHFTLQEAFTTPEGYYSKAIVYKADFSYDMLIYTRCIESRTGMANEDYSWQFVVEDVKSKATKTPVYSMKKKLMQEKFGITITEVE